MHFLFFVLSSSHATMQGQNNLSLSLPPLSLLFLFLCLFYDRIALHFHLSFYYVLWYFARFILMFFSFDFLVSCRVRIILYIGIDLLFVLHIYTLVYKCNMCFTNKISTNIVIIVIANNFIYLFLFYFILLYDHWNIFLFVGLIVLSFKIFDFYYFGSLFL